MRRALSAFLLCLAACDAGARERELAAAVDSTRAATLESVEQLLGEVVNRTDEAAGHANGILRPMPVMTPAEENALRAYLNDTHVARARALGVRLTDDETIDSLLAAGRLIELEDSTAHWIVRPRTSPAHVVPHVRELLRILGERFQAELAALDLPPYRIEVTSAERTSARQAALRRNNANAAAGVSSHEFGTTVDLSYAAFAPPLEIPPDVLDGVPAELAPHLERLVDLAFESVSGRKSRELGAIFGRVLRQAQAEGLVLVIYERAQTVHHVTVGRALADEP